MTAPQEKYRRYLETLTRDRLKALPDHVTQTVRFKDPFNDVRGADDMGRVFDHMFDKVEDIRFRVHHALNDGNTCLMAWRFEGCLKGALWVFDGTSVITFAPDGRVAEHIDHWDAARNFYERLPVIGWLLARLRRQLAIR